MARQGLTRAALLDSLTGNMEQTVTAVTASPKFGRVVDALLGTANCLLVGGISLSACRHMHRRRAYSVLVLLK